MATDLAPAPDSTTADTPPARRHYWQLPLFCLGVAAAVAAWRAYPPPTPDFSADVGRQTYTLRQAIDKRPIDPKAVTALADKLAAKVDAKAGDPAARYAIGSAYMLLAEGVSPETAGELWTKASTYLSAIDPLSLTETKDQQRCVFRSAKATAAVGGGEPKSLFAALSEIPAAEEPGERSRLLAETCLRLQPPDNVRAKEEIANYLAGQNKASPASVAKLKLKLADLCLMLNEKDRARTWLEQIDAAAPADLQAAAKLQRGRLSVADRDWNTAVKLFQAAEQAPNLPTDLRAEVRFEIGRGLLALNNANEAKRYLRLASGDAGAAAAAAIVTLGEVSVRDAAAKADRLEVAQKLGGVLRNVRTPADWVNPFIPVERLRTCCESLIVALDRDAEFDPALALTTAYGPVADGRERTLRADVLKAWGERAKKDKQADLSRNKLALAAAEYRTLADTRSNGEKSQLLLAAADCLFAADDTVETLKLLDVISTGGDAAAAARAEMQKGELLRPTDFAGAEAAYKKAMTAGGSTSTEAAVRLGQLYRDRAKERQAKGDPKADAEAAGLTQLAFDLFNQVAGKTPETTADRENQQRALFELGKMLRGQRNAQEAEVRFREAVQVHPTGPNSELAKLYLGFCLIEQARGDTTGRPANDKDRKLTEAINLFDALGKSPDPWVQTKADLWLANTTLEAGGYDQMPAVCDRLAKKHQGKVEELILIRILRKSHLEAGRPDLAADVLKRLEQIYATLPAEAYVGDMPECRRDHWTTWFEQTKRR